MMYSIIAEFLKIRRNRLILILYAVAFLSPLIAPMTAGSSGPVRELGFREYLDRTQLPVYFSHLMLTVIMSAVVFGGEYRDRTIVAMFTTGTSRQTVVAAKLIAITVVLFSSIVGSGLINFTLSSIITGGSGNIPFGRYIGSICLSVSYYAALIPFAAMLSVVLRKVTLPALIYIAVTIVIFPFYNQAEYIPPLLPMHLMLYSLAQAAERTSSAFFVSELHLFTAIISMAAFFIIPLLIVVIQTRRSDITR